MLVCLKYERYTQLREIQSNEMQREWSPRNTILQYKHLHNQTCKIQWYYYGVVPEVDIHMRLLIRRVVGDCKNWLAFRNKVSGTYTMSSDRFWNMN